MAALKRAQTGGHVQTEYRRHETSGADLVSEKTHPAPEGEVEMTCHPAVADMNLPWFGLLRTRAARRMTSAHSST